MSGLDGSTDGEYQPRGRDLSDGLLDYRSAEEQRAINTFIDEVTVIRRLRVGVACVLVMVLAGLGAALWVTICSFTRQVDKATPEIRHLVEAAKAGEGRDPAAEGSADPTGMGRPVAKAVLPASGASAPAVVEAVATPIFTTSVKVDIASMAGSIVAVISILVIAISAIAISLLRATFGLAAHRRDEPQATDAKDAEASKNGTDGGGVPLPAMELLKSLIECVKSIAGKSEKPGIA